MREAGLDELQKELPKAETIRRELGIDEMRPEMEQLKDDLSDWTTPPPTVGTPDTLPGDDPSTSISSPANPGQPPDTPNTTPSG